MSSHEIQSVRPGSLADLAGLKAKDTIIKMNNVLLKDIFDYHYYSDEPSIDLEVLHSDGSTSIFHIDNEYGEDLGIIFVNGLMDDYKSCHNKCMFCFIDQMPPGMRDTLYFKDDDTRLSFLQGNYVTLTNMKYEDLDRIITYKLAPINISVHATNPELRVRMLKNRFAGDILDKIKYLYEHEIPMNSQIVLCRGINDGKELERTISELLDFYPYMQSLSVVPVGLTKYRDGLEPLIPFDEESAKETIDIIEKWQNISYERYGIHFAQASDEWYLLANRQLPDANVYDGYIQLENGVGMLRLLEEEVNEAISTIKRPLFFKERTITIATGRLAYEHICMLSRRIEEKYKKIHINVVAIKNDYFGESITVSGLICGQDLISQLKNKDLGDCLLLPCNMLKQDEEIFLDDITLEELRSALQVDVSIVKSSGDSLVKCVLGIKN